MSEALMSTSNWKAMTRRRVRQAWDGVAKRIQRFVHLPSTPDEALLKWMREPGNPRSASTIHQTQLRPLEKFVKEIENSLRVLDFSFADGTKGQSETIIFGAAGSFVIGHKEIAHAVRYELTGEGR